MNPLSALLKAILQGISFCRVLNTQVQLLCSQVHVYCSLLKTCRYRQISLLRLVTAFPFSQHSGSFSPVPRPPPKPCLGYHSCSSTVPSCKLLFATFTLYSYNSDFVRRGPPFNVQMIRNSFFPSKPSQVHILYLNLWLNK